MGRFSHVLCITAAIGASAASSAASDEPWPLTASRRAAPVTEKLSFLSSTMGDHMVLQRAPQQAVVWGHTAPGGTVSTTFQDKTYTTTANKDGVWRQVLPPTPASTTAYTLKFASSAGEAAQLQDVLFGDVYLCGGQSNMQFAVGGGVNVTEETAIADKYPYIRVFTVGQGTSSATPLGDLQTIEQPWAVANGKSIAGGGPFGYFSAVCWFFGRTISDSLAPNRDMPIGLISNNWGGTSIEQWSTPDVIEGCHRTYGGKDGELYNAMIHPYTIGPMALTGFTWYQGEANSGDPDGYSCFFPAMISMWRQVFNRPNAYFGFIQLSTWCEAPTSLMHFRDVQLEALKLPMVGYATNADHGAGCNIHPQAKQYCGERLGKSALALQYKEELEWRSPTFSSWQKVAADAESVSVTVSLDDLSADGLVALDTSYNAVADLDCAQESLKAPLTCAWAAVEVQGLGLLNATASASPGGMTLRAKLPQGVSSVKVLSASYGWGFVPMLTLYDKRTGLPVLPWNKTATVSEPVVV